MIQESEIQVYSLSTLLEAETNNNVIEELLSSFISEKNKDVQNFLHLNAIENEKRSISRTTLVVDNTNVIGYFTLLIKDFSFVEVSKSTRKKLTGNKWANNFITILIAQLGRSDLYKGKISGDVILNLALERCEVIKELSALRIVCLEHDDIEGLNIFYEKNAFEKLQINENDKVIRFVRI